MNEKPKKNWPRRIWSSVWGSFLGILVGTAASSALRPVIKAEWLKELLVDGVKFGIDQFSTSLGFFEFSFGFNLRFTFLSAIFMTATALLLLFLPFKEN
ncbi:hypothetical protein JXM67_06040 [candidate division WOR-3 bacterium]|nr:hypothetical protein [candidate division WOR-3 bacterium]